MKELEKNQRLALASSMRRVPHTIENEEKGTTYDTIKWRTSGDHFCSCSVFI